MKTIHKLLGLVCAFALMPLLAHAQFVQPVTRYSAVTNTGSSAFTVAASATTNVPTTAARIIPIGANGFGVHVYATAAGTSLATNTLAFEYSGDGVNFVLQPLLQVFVTNNTATPVTYFTNFPNTIQNVGNIAAIRLKHITNSAAQVTYWTNIYVTTR